MAKTAIRPDFFSKLPSLVKEDRLDKSGITDEERFLYGMSQTSGYPIFLRKKEALLQDLDVLLSTAIASGASEGEIGKNAIIINMVKGVVNKLFTCVDDAKEACESTGGA